MDIYEFAMNMELDGKKYYEELGEKTNSKGLKAIFEMMADDELKHYNIIKEFKENNELEIESSTLRNANNIFAQMLKSPEDFSGDISEVDAYKHATKLENDSIAFYQKHKEQATNKRDEIAFDKLALEEKKHKLILENIIEFITEPDKGRGVKTIDSDPEFARWDKSDLGE